MYESAPLSPGGLVLPPGRCATDLDALSLHFRRRGMQCVGRGAMMNTERLHNLGSELARIAVELSGASTNHAGLDPSGLPIGKIRDVLRSRRLRENMLPEGLFADPALDMLLELSARQAEGRTISITELCNSAGIALTTGLRWVSDLQARGLVDRASDAADKRKAHLRLSEDGTVLISSYITAAAEAGLPLA
ncbi:MAG: hypothetical protein EON58_02365 [Alphaproteobacteria bacterium]|nr:MAG: hypothetical protein EON58_02365 [Alphaproteobacteria bacterium]